MATKHLKSFIVEKSPGLHGAVRVSGNKNAALPMIAAALLTDGEIVLKNVPEILDVSNMLRIADALGVSSSLSKGILRLKRGGKTSVQIPGELCNLVRTSMLFAGPLLARCGKAVLSRPGGDSIGRRRLDAHFYGLKCLGAKLDSIGDQIVVEADKLRGRDIFFDEASVTATEHILMTAALADGVTVIRNAASEPHVQDLAELLRKMGARISGIGTNTLTVRGVEKLGGAEHEIMGDHIEAGSYLALAAATGAELTIRGIRPGHFWMTRRIFEKFGIKIELSPSILRIPGGQMPVVEREFGNATPVISDGPWPQYPSDMMSCSIVMATQAHGSVLFFEKMFESRIYFVDKLIGMGANAIVCDPHRVVISGPSELHGTEMSSPDIRAGMAMLIAAICANGKSVISNAQIISRGYENIVEKLESIGVKIKVQTS